MGKAQARGRASRRNLRLVSSFVIVVVVMSRHNSRAQIHAVLLGVGYCWKVMNEQTVHPRTHVLMMMGHTVLH